MLHGVDLRALPADRMLNVLYVLPAMQVDVLARVDRARLAAEFDAQVVAAVQDLSADPETWGLSPEAIAAEARLLDLVGDDEDETEADDGVAEGRGSA